MMLNQIVLYVQMGETRYRRFFEEHLVELQKGFENQGMTLVFLPSLMGKGRPNISEGLRTYLEFYYPSFRRLTKLQQDQSLQILLQSQNETDVYEKLNDMFGLSLRPGAYLFYIMPGRFEFERLSENEDPESVLKKYRYNADQQRASRSYSLDPEPLEDFYQKHNILVNQPATLDSEKPHFKSLRSALNWVMQSNQDRVHEGELHPELAEILDYISTYNLETGAVQLIDQIMMTLAASRGVIYNGIEEWAPKSLPANLERTSKLRLAGNDVFLVSIDKKLELDPIHRAVYVLFMKHPEGILYSHLGDYREELHSLYSQFSGAMNAGTIRSRIDLLCNPLDNSKIEKISRINKYIRSLGLGPSQELYTITGPRGQAKKIHLAANLREFSDS